MNTIAYDAIQHSLTIHGAPAWISFTFASPEVAAYLEAESDSGPQQDDRIIRYYGHDAEGNEWCVCVATELAPHETEEP